MFAAASAGSGADAGICCSVEAACAIVVVVASGAGADCCGVSCEFVVDVDAYVGIGVVGVAGVFDR